MTIHSKTRLIQSALAALVLGAMLVPAAFADNSQQSKMTVCNQQASGKKGDERKAFMKSCLSASPAAAPMTQQEKMKACNTEASGKKGDDRKAFMKSCLSSSNKSNG
ncbi:PsiF family protein [Paraburkholderia bonniea]|uniref:PsiF family protein n=1 Tax=Paraburkholderia bonniea TaxID=2152891 RepID=UPI0012913E91|nr:PsiF family protein [Paraburkholderia bonniea]WJF89066.1 PsiF family protein [Paraburkholderia bonniea]WJF92382.1 PsiF family protein [Paraburkholderia bonniea]